MLWCTCKPLVLHREASVQTWSRHCTVMFWRSRRQPHRNSGNCSPEVRKLTCPLQGTSIDERWCKHAANFNHFSYLGTLGSFHWEAILFYSLLCIYSGERGVEERGSSSCWKCLIWFAFDQDWTRSRLGDHCTLACFWSGSVWPEPYKSQPEPNQIQDGFAQYDLGRKEGQQWFCEKTDSFRGSFTHTHLIKDHQ